MRLKRVCLCLLLLLLLPGCAGQDRTGKPEVEDQAAVELPAIRLPEISVDDTRQHEYGGWVVDIPDVKAGGTYRVSSDNDLWVNFSFNEPMDQEQVMEHLLVEPLVEMETQWFQMGRDAYWFRVHLFPTEPGETVKVGVTAGARSAKGDKALAEDMVVTLERFPAPWATMYLEDYPGMKMDQCQYWTSPQEARVVMEFNKPMDRDGLERALDDVVKPTERKINWLNDRKAVIRFTPDSESTKTYYLSLAGAKDQDGILLSMPDMINLTVVSDVKVMKMDPAAGTKKEAMIASGGYAGASVSPDGTRAVFWEVSCDVGDITIYRYWLQDLESGRKVLLNWLLFRPGTFMK